MVRLFLQRTLLQFGTDGTCRTHIQSKLAMDQQHPNTIIVAWLHSLQMINRHGWTTVNSASAAYDREACSCLVDRQQAAVARSTAECNKRGYTVRGLLDAGTYTTVQMVAKKHRTTKDVVNPVWMLDSDPKEPDQESTTVRIAVFVFASLLSRATL